jgi:hypothetical protein
VLIVSLFVSFLLSSLLTWPFLELSRSMNHILSVMAQRDFMRKQVNDIRAQLCSMDDEIEFEQSRLRSQSSDPNMLLHHLTSNLDTPLELDDELIKMITLAGGWQTDGISEPSILVRSPSGVYSIVPRSTLPLELRHTAISVPADFDVSIPAPTLPSFIAPPSFLSAESIQARGGSIPSLPVPLASPSIVPNVSENVDEIMNESGQPLPDIGEPTAADDGQGKEVDVSMEELAPVEKNVEKQFMSTNSAASGASLVDRSAPNSPLQTSGSSSIAPSRPPPRAIGKAAEQRAPSAASSSQVVGDFDTYLAKF